MKRKIAMLIFGILLIGIVSAGLIDYFGRITGSVEVKAPVFYLDGNHSDGGVYHKLYVNQIPPEEIIYFWNGERIIFKTNDLEVDEFYPVRFDVKVWMKTNNSGNTVQARFIKLDSQNHEETICDVSSPISISATENFYKYEFSCESNEEIDLDPYNRIGLELRGNGNSSQEYWISSGKDDTEGVSRIEVTAK